MSHLKLRLLGSAQIERNGARCDVRSRKALGLLAYLAVTDQPHTRAHLATLLWPEQRESRALAYLRHTLWTLRQALGDDLLQRAQDQVGIAPHVDVWVDTRAFQARIARYVRDDPESHDGGAPHLDSLRRAVALYRGEFLAGFTLRDSPAFDEWQLFERETLCDWAATALQQLATGYSARGEYARAIPYARRWLALDPLHEPAQRMLMQLYADNNQHGAAQRQYAECTRILRAELETTPDKATTRLFEQISSKHLPVDPDRTMSAAPVRRSSGHNQQAAAMPASQGQLCVVTVLCAGLTELPVPQPPLEPERAARKMRTLLAAAQDVLKRYEGQIVQVLGDRFLALLGATQPHEDDPERALQAAWRLQRVAQAQSISLGIAVHSGPVILHAAHADGVPPQVLGPVVNLAERMQTQAEAGDILVSKSTYHQARGAFEFLPVALSLRRSRRPLTAYLVQKQQTEPSKARGLEHLQAQLVGRDQELTRLRQASIAAASGAGRVITIVGEAGVGKSRLIAELKARRPDRSALWLEGRAQELVANSGYWPFVDLIQRYLRWQPHEGKEKGRSRLEAVMKRLQEHRVLTDSKAARIMTQVERLLGIQTAPISTASDNDVPARERRQTLVALRDLLLALAALQPIIVALEDLHWADPLSLDLIALLVDALAQRPILLICIYRPEEEHDGTCLGQIAAKWCPERHDQVRLRELSMQQSRRLVAGLLNNPTLSPACSKFLLAKSQGNPLFLEELIHTLIEIGALYRVNGKWFDQPNLTNLVLPDTLQSLILARVARLPAPLRQVAQRAAVIGRTFSAALLTALDDVEGEREATLLPALRELTERAFLSQNQDASAGSYSFRHVLVQEAIYSSLLRADRRRLHENVARALEQLYPAQIPAQLGLLAHHWQCADQPQKAVHYWQLAGDRARLAYAQAEAVHGYRRALDLLLAQGDYATAARTYMKLGLTEQNGANYDAAHCAFNDGFLLWQQAAMRATPAAAAPDAAFRLYSGEPQTLDPAMASDEMSENAIQELFSGLVALTPDMGIVPDVAQSWHILHSGRTYRFHLRPDVVWSDGTPLTAHDFVFAWRRVLDPRTESSAAQHLYAIRGAQAFHAGLTQDPTSIGITARDDHVLLVELDAPTGYFLTMLTQTFALPVPRHVIREVGQRWTDEGTIVSNGPFVLAAWSAGKQMSLRANPRYHGVRQGNAHEILLQFSHTITEAVARYEAGQLDLLPLADLPSRQRDLLRRRHMEEYLSAPRLATIFLSLEVSRPPFSAPQLRQALALATDRKALAGDTLRGYDFPASGMVPSGMPGHSAASGLPYDPEQARRLLAEAGYPPGSGFPDISAWAWPGIRPICDALSRQWQNVLGIDVRWRYFPWQEVAAIGDQGYPDLFLYGYAFTYPDPDGVLRRLYGTRLIRWQNDAYAQMIAQAGSSQDQRQRLHLYRKADRLLCAEAPVIPLLYERLHMLVKPHVRSFPTSAIKWNYWKDVLIDPPADHETTREEQRTSSHRHVAS